MRTAAQIEACRQALRDRFPVWRPRTLADWLDDCAEQYGTSPFVITDELTLSYTEVCEQSRRIAAGLIGLGVQPGDRVGMLMANYPEFIAVKFAIARTGAIAVPFNYLYRTAELGFVLADSGCRVLITMSGFGALDYQSMLDEIVPQWDSAGFAHRPLDSVPDLRHVVVLDTDGRARRGVHTVADLAATTAATQPVAVAPDAPGDMLYTSGTTGSPKGVLVTHDAVLRTGYASALTRGYQSGRRILFSLPCYHMFGYVEGVLSVMFVGGAIIPQPSFSADGYLAGIERHRATDILCVPTMAVAMAQSPARGDYDLSSLEAVLCGSAPAPIWLWEKLERDFGVSEIVTGYGMTECGGAMTLTLPEDALYLTSETVGRPKLAGSASVPGTDALVRYEVVDGELVSSGPTTMVGYWCRPAETAAALRDGRLFSGDLGFVRSDGYLEVTGRSKELYKSGGELVMPKEIEDLLAAHPAISQAFAFGLTDERWGEIGCVVVVPIADAALTEGDVLDICRANLARFKVPKRVVFYAADALPTTPTGKVQKFRLVQALS
ncbi:class I adenylate-forming enzyme family protein [Mycolicibacterium aubagnense]|uniref:class I adenylate-forming enzyme family protein n=1 Tax=Mycolicibacterium aubagnense TaxID=319707 RepID=UPI0010FD8BF4|nr:class I adenylate-forming enzyme family protein [Mycolicibacterium aubagnense]TLH49984.1 acyl--CoA ligase [Mycolicibacterium aubagnense]WGI33451.1 class I adenylate-forming enzyme family protein [Mycolicibacterium aubagnense]